MECMERRATLSPFHGDLVHFHIQVVQRKEKGPAVIMEIIWCFERRSICRTRQ